MRKGSHTVPNNWKTRIIIETENGCDEKFSVEKDVTQPDETALLTAISQATETFLKYMDSEVRHKIVITKSTVSDEISYNHLDYTAWAAHQ